MTEKLKLTIKKPLSLNKQSQLFQALKPLHEQAKKEKHQDLQQQRQNEREAKQKKREEIKVALRWLYEQFPACFNPKDLKPLKLNIDKDLFSFLEKENSPSKVKLRDALTYFTSNVHYLKAIINGTHRYDLNGQQAEEITQEQKDFAQNKLEKILQSIKTKNQHKIKSSS
ncbi:MAG: ProQ/FinO family protein [Candidatus Paracaedimonas acanthamoebae]|uniref:ProQ/FinO family protein n=1 Tax=Candidatus Paracaedimonas acanthamoebae TaxID=244581 RepID=A0A8J7TTQ1_9PROT|nr:ProQ/FinO family protein [Holosporales bacterium]MBN9413591.1 ProQ/FinO family protein [Candidatus Paracaedimonas acanthamoebae]OJX02564.1 MAG: hypothetical protein BGO76_06730 [Caedibacter sp. 38-128]